MNTKPNVFVVMPAYNAERTLEKTYREIPKSNVTKIIVVDDKSMDHTVDVAKHLGLEVIVHEKNLGYGGNQKTCYDAALSQGADIVVMVHPDYQYDPSVLPQMIEAIQNGQADIMFGSRMLLKKDALAGGMPLYKFCSNIFLTFFENLVFRRRLSEYHTGLRAYSRHFLKHICYHDYSNGFIFDTEIVASACHHGFKIGEVAIKTRYQQDSSSISFKDSIVYGLLTLNVLRKYLLKKRKHEAKVKTSTEIRPSHCG
ncbi:MAG: glycosyltransferase family 2 protein [Deltaproteobacteria bacterium]|nr:glycosyltransferase family 2 protein [Deltaproteobacteria bacterium]